MGIINFFSLQSLMLNEKISREIGMDFHHLTETAHNIEVNVEADKFLLLSTAIILQILEMQFSSESGTWAGVIQKSKDWMANMLRNGKPRLNGIDLMDWAEEFVLTNISIGGKKNKLGKGGV